MSEELPDIQQTSPLIKIPLREVGVENVEVPFKLESRDGEYNEMIARVSMRSDIDCNTKGVSMSRFLLTLRKYLNEPLKHWIIKDILIDLRKNIGSCSSFMKFNFKLPYDITSIKSMNNFPVYLDCMFEGRLSPGNHFRFFQGITIQYSSYCPCSAELSKDLLNKSGQMGFPHAQRSFAKILIEVKEPNIVWLEEIIYMVYSVIKTKPYPIIKRVDEQEIAKVASNNPLFVEDACRLISRRLDENNKVYDWVVKCIHEESIHTSEAIAVNWKGREGGLTGASYYL